MSTSFEKIFTETTILQRFSVKINDQEILNEDVLSLEIMFDYSKPFIQGTMVIKDSYGISDLGIFDGNTRINVYCSDYYGEKFSRVFRVAGLANDEYNDRFKKYTFNLVDELYYALANTYISKSYTGNPVSAFGEFLTELQLDTYMSENNITTDIDDYTGDDYSFVIPQNVSALDFFSDEFKRLGLRFWQSRKTLHIKNVVIKDLDHVQVNGENAKFSNNTDNDKYGFKIHDFRMKIGNLLSANLVKPIVQHQAFNINTKTIDTTTNNLEDVYSDMTLNNLDMSGVQHTSGQRYDVDAGVFSGKQKLELEDTYLGYNILEVVVPGNVGFTDVCKKAEVVLKGNPLVNTSAIEGDVVFGGDYFISKVSDRYIGDKMIQKLVLNRIDSREPRSNR